MRTLLRLDVAREGVARDVRRARHDRLEGGRWARGRRVEQRRRHERVGERRRRSDERGEDRTDEKHYLLFPSPALDHAAASWNPRGRPRWSPRLHVTLEDSSSQGKRRQHFLDFPGG